MVYEPKLVAYFSSGYDGYIFLKLLPPQKIVVELVLLGNCIFSMKIYYGIVGVTNDEELNSKDKRVLQSVIPICSENQIKVSLGKLGETFGL